MSRIGKQLLNQTKTTLYGTGEKDSNWRARDLLSLLIRANMSTDIAGGHQMTDEDVLARKTCPHKISEQLSQLTQTCRGSDIPGCWTRNYKVRQSIISSFIIR